MRWCTYTGWDQHATTQGQHNADPTAMTKFVKRGILFSLRLPLTCSIAGVPRIVADTDPNASVTCGGNIPELASNTSGNNTIITSTVNRSNEVKNCTTTPSSTSPAGTPLPASAKGFSARSTSCPYCLDSMRRCRASSIDSGDGFGEAWWGPVCRPRRGTGLHTREGRVPVAQRAKNKVASILVWDCNRHVAQD